MNSCGSDTENDDRPLLRVQLSARGEDAIRMDKRLRCAGRALGVKVEVDWDAGTYGEPVVRIGDQLVVDHLVETPELERLLKPYIKPENTQR